MTSGDSAESVVRMMLQGSEIILKLSGSGAKNIGVAIYALSKEEKNTVGKTNLMNMLKSKKECRVFSLKEDDLKLFNKQTKAYGIMYCALVNKKEKSKDGMIDIMVKSEDASRVNRIISRYNLASVDRAIVEQEAVMDLNANKKTKVKTKTKIIEEVKINEKIDTKPIRKEDNSIDPKYLGEKKKSQSENSLNSNKNLEEGLNKDIKPSVKEKLDTLKEKVKTKNESKIKEKEPQTKKSKKKNKSKER